jgi:hypothetical protein
MRDDIHNERCPRCGSQLNHSTSEKHEMCESCSAKFAPSAAALKETLVYWEDSSGIRTVLKHIIVLSAIGVVALIAYYMGS